MDKRIYNKATYVKTERGITIYTIISPIPDEEKLNHIRNEILGHSLYQNDFEGTYFNLSNEISPTERWVKIRSPMFAFQSVSSSKKQNAPKYYKSVFDALFSHIKNVFNIHGFKMLGFSFGVNYQIHPEEPSNIIELSEELTALIPVEIELDEE